MKSRQLLCLLAAIALLVSGQQSARATVFTIPDGDVVALKNAIAMANGNGADDTIELAAGGSYTLTAVENTASGPNGLPVIGTDGGHSLTIHGNASTIRRSVAGGTLPFRIFHIGEEANVTISGLMLTNGELLNVRGADSFAQSGAGIYNRGALTLNNCIITGNAADFGGGIFNDGIHGKVVLTINNSGFSRNTAVSGGGAIYTASQVPGNAAVTLENCALSGNSADHGGALVNDTYSGNSIVTMHNCILSGNWAEVIGGGIENVRASGSAMLSISSSSLTGNIVDPSGVKGGDGGAIYNRGDCVITNSTLNGNSATDAGGGIYNRSNLTIISSTLSKNSGLARTEGSGIYNGGRLTLTGSTLSENHGPGIFNDGLAKGNVVIGSTILKTGARGANIYNFFDGAVKSGGHNLSNDDGGGFLTAPNDRTNTDPKLDPNGLQNNGGPTKTIALLPGSPALRGGDPKAPARDQRFYLRNRLPDIGAIERRGTLAPISAVSRKRHGAIGTFDVDLPPTGEAGIECRSGGAAGDYQIVLTFASPITAAGASITSGRGEVRNLTVSGAEARVDLTGVTNGQQIEVVLSDVTDGSAVNNVAVPMRVLLGDVIGTGSVDMSDLVATNSRIGQAITQVNFRFDVMLGGTINAADVAVVKSQAGADISAASLEADHAEESENN